jgi:hypothetical protein
MAIKVKHEGNVTSRIFAASEGGRGKRRAEDAIRLAEIQSRADIAAQDRSTRGGGVSAPSPGSPGVGHAPVGPSGLISPPFRRDAHGQQPDFAGKYTKGGLTDPWMTEREAEQEYLKANPGATREDVYKHLDSLGHMDGGSYLKPGERAYPSDFKFTSQQKSEFDRLNESYEEARRSGDFSEDELKELRRQIIAKQAGIKPLPTLEDGSKDPWTLAQARIFTDPGTGRQGYLDKDGVPQFYDKESEGGANRQEFLKRYETVKKDLTKPKYKKDTDGKMIEDGEEVPDAATILKALQEQDKAWEMYEKGQGGEQGGEIAAHVADPAQQTSRGAPPNPAMRRRMAEIAELGQDPDAPGGYSDRKVSNGKYIPKYLEGFITNEGIDQKAILEAAKLKAGASGGAITEEDVVAAIAAELNELAKPPRKR